MRHIIVCFSSYCEKHRIQQTVPKQKKRMSTKLDECAICLCEVEPRPSNNVLIAPCCQNSFLHRECVQVSLIHGSFSSCSEQTVTQLQK